MTQWSGGSRNPLNRRPRTVFDQVQQRDAETQERSLVRREASSYRRWAPNNRWAARFFPRGQEYERRRMEFPNLRPSRVNLGELQGQAFRYNSPYERYGQSDLGDLQGRAFTGEPLPTDYRAPRFSLGELQEGAFRGENRMGAEQAFGRFDERQQALLSSYGLTPRSVRFEGPEGRNTSTTYPPFERKVYLDKSRTTENISSLVHEWAHQLLEIQYPEMAESQGLHHLAMGLAGDVGEGPATATVLDPAKVEAAYKTVLEALRRGATMDEIGAASFSGGALNVARQEGLVAGQKQAFRSEWGTRRPLEEVLKQPPQKRIAPWVEKPGWSPEGKQRGRQLNVEFNRFIKGLEREGYFKKEAPLTSPPTGKRTRELQNLAGLGGTWQKAAKAATQRRGQKYAERAAELGYPFEKEPLDVHQLGQGPFARTRIATPKGPGYRIFSPAQEKARLKLVRERVGSLGPGGDKLVLAGAIGANELNRLERGDPKVFQAIIKKAQKLPEKVRNWLSFQPDVQEFLQSQGKAFTESREAISPSLGAIDPEWLGVGAEQAALHAGAPEEVQTGLRIGVPIVAGVGAPAAGFARLPAVLKTALVAAGVGPNISAAQQVDELAKLAATHTDEVVRTAARAELENVATTHLSGTTREAAEGALGGVSRPEPGAIRPRPAAPEPPPVRAAPEAAEGVRGGAALTHEQLAARIPETPREGLRQLVTNPFRGAKWQAREVHRLYNGALNFGNKLRKVWADDTHKLAKQAGMKIARGGDSAQQGDETIDMMERLWERSPIGIFPERARPLAQSLYQRLDDIEQRILAADPDWEKQMIADYFPHLFKKVGAGGRRGFRTRVTGQRKLQGPLAEILEERPDLDLVSWDPIEFVARHEAAADSYVASLEAIQTLKAKDLIRLSSDAPTNWRKPNIPIFQPKGKLNHWTADPAVATRLEDMFGSSAFDEHGLLKAVRGTRNVAFAAKTFGGLFQGVDFTARSALGMGTREAARAGLALATGRLPTAAEAGANAVRAWANPFRAVARSTIPGLDNMLNRAATNSPDLKILYQNGLGAGADPSYVQGAIRGMGGLVPQSAGGQQIPGAKVLANTLEYVSGGAYEKFHTEMLEQAGLINFRRLLRGGRSRAEAARMAAEETNVFFSSIPNWQSAVVSATGRDLGRIALFSLGEFEAWPRMMVQTPGSLAGLLGGTAIAAAMLHKFMTGEDMPEDRLIPFKGGEEAWEKIKNGDPSGLLDLEYNTTFLRPTLPWKGPLGRELYLDMLGQADTPLRWSLDPMFALETRAGQIPKALYDIAVIKTGGTPLFAEPIKDAGDALRYGIQSVAPISVAGLLGTEQGRIGAAAAGTQAAGLNVSSQRLGDLARQRYEEISGKDFNDETDWTVARELAKTDPEYASLQPIFDEMDRLSLEFENAGALEREERTGFLAEEIDKLRLPELVERYNAGDTEVTAGLKFAFREYENTAAVAGARDYYGTAEPDDKSPKGRALNAYYDISPQDFMDDTGVPDFDEFSEARDAAFEKFRKLDPEAAAAIESKQKFADPAIEKVYREYKQAKDIKKELDAILPVEGVTEEQWTQLEAIWARAEELREENPRLATTVSIGRAAEAMGLSDWSSAARRYREGSSTRERARNPEYIDALRENEAILRKWYPSLYEADWIQEELGTGTSQTSLSQNGVQGSVAQAAQQYGLNPSVLAALIGVESSGNSNAVSSAGAAGLTQIMPATYGSIFQQHPELARYGATGSPNDRFNPTISLYAGAAHLGDLLRDAGGDYATALGAYYAGWGGRASGEAQNYARLVLSRVR